MGPVSCLAEEPLRLMNWYPVYFGCLVALWVWSTPKERNNALVLLLAAAVSTLSVRFITCHIAGAWKLAVPAGIETGTIIALLAVSGWRTALIQVVCLLFSWWVHVLCFVDIKRGSNLVYSNYEALLLFTSTAQLLAFHGTLWHHFSRFVQAGLGRLDRVRHPSVVDAVVPRENHPRS